VICKKCNIEKDVSEFRHKKRTCKKCTNFHQREYYKLNKKKCHNWSNNHFKKLKKIITDLKEKPCFDCGRTFPHWAMEFDHLSDKTMSVSAMLYKHRFPIKKIVEETNKCQVICALCHRHRTYMRTKPPSENIKIFSDLLKKWFNEKM
jgi:YesN/AraC family two-component response regulator